MDKYFVRVHVVVEEHGDKAVLDNPGGAEWMAKVGGKDAGLPYFAFLDGSGAVLVNSMRPQPGRKPANIGYPSEPVEIEWFMTMLAKAAPQMEASEATTLEQWLRLHAK